MIDVSRPLAPVEVGRVDTPGLWAWDVAADGAHAYLTNATTGLRVFRGCGTLWDPRESFIPAAALAAGAEGSFFQTDVEINNDDSRANVGCVNGTAEPLRINIRLFNDQGTFLGLRTMDLGPHSNNQINRVFRDYQPVNGCVDVWADSNDALYYCYGSVLDNVTSDPTTVLPQ